MFNFTYNGMADLALAPVDISQHAVKHKCLIGNQWKPLHFPYFMIYFKQKNAKMR